MKKSYALVLLIAVLVAMAAAACKKDKDPDPAPAGPSKRALMLQSHSWKYNSYFYLIKNNDAIPYNMPACMLDDRLDFMSGGKYIKYGGQDLCSGQPVYDTLSWELLMGDLRLKVTSKTTSVTKDIISFTADSLVTLEVSQTGDSLAYLYLKY